MTHRTRAVLFSLLLLLTACEAPWKDASEAPSLIRVGVLPDEAEARLRTLYDPLLAYLASATGLELALEVPRDYDALVDAFDAGALDLAWFGGLTFSQARERSGAEPLVSRDIDARFSTVFVTAGNAEGNKLESFSGMSLAFGPQLSTSGHLMARAFLEERGIRPEAFFGDVRYSAGHDETAAWVRDGKVAIGAVNAQIIRAIFDDGRIAKGDLRVIGTTPPYQDYVWATRDTLDPAVRRALLGAFLALDPAVPEHAILLRRFGAGGYVPVAAEAFKPLQQVASELGLLGEER